MQASSILHCNIQYQYNNKYEKEVFSEYLIKLSKHNNAKVNKETGFLVIQD